jgi:hypothetical protein
LRIKARNHAALQYKAPLTLYRQRATLEESGSRADSAFYGAVHGFLGNQLVHADAGDFD